MYCTVCGTEINNEAIICPHCGVATQNYNASKIQGLNGDKNGMAIAGFVCSFFIPLLGWIFSGIGLHRANKRNGKNKGFAVAGIVISCVMFVFNLLLL